ncbi:MAG: hypothetical protein ABIH28_02750 [archaeon]
MKKDEISHGMKEFDLAWNEFFKKKKRPKKDEEDRKQQEEFMHWYNYVRKQTDTGKTPAEMFEEIYRKEPGSKPKEPSRIMNFEWDENYKELDEMFYEADQSIIKGKYKEALKLADKILEIIPDAEEALLLKTIILPPLGRTSEAEEILKFVNKKYGKTADWNFHRAQLYFWNGSLSKAMGFMKQALEKNPDNFDALIGYANYLDLAREESFKEYLEKAEKLDKERAKRFKKKYWITQKEYIQKGMFTGALDNIVNLLEEQKEAEARQDIGLLLKYSNELPKDILTMLLGLEIEGYMVAEEYETASQKIEALLKINTKNSHAYFYMSQLLFIQKKLEDALTEIDKCLENAENSDVPIPHPDFYFLKSMILKKLDNDEYIYYENKAKELMKGTKFLGDTFKELMKGEKDN